MTTSAPILGLAFLSAGTLGAMIATALPFWAEYEWKNFHVGLWKICVDGECGYLDSTLGVHNDSHVKACRAFSVLTIVLSGLASTLGCCHAFGTSRPSIVGSKPTIIAIFILGLLAEACVMLTTITWVVHYTNELGGILPVESYNPWALGTAYYLNSIVSILIQIGCIIILVDFGREPASIRVHHRSQPKKSATPKGVQETAAGDPPRQPGHVQPINGQALFASPQAYIQPAMGKSVYGKSLAYENPQIVQVPAYENPQIAQAPAYGDQGIGQPPAYKPPSANIGKGTSVQPASGPPTPETPANGQDNAAYIVLE